MATRLNQQALYRAACALERGELPNILDAPVAARALRIVWALECSGEDVEALYSKRLLLPFAERLLEGAADMHEQRGELETAAEARLARSQLTGQNVIVNMIDFEIKQAETPLSVREAVKRVAERLSDPRLPESARRYARDVEADYWRAKRAEKKPKKPRGRPRKPK